MRKAANTILMIDDEPQIRRFVKAGLELYGYSVSEAEKGSMGLNAVAQSRPDLIILDLGLPDMSGIDAMIAIHGQFPEARIIMMTTFEGDDPIQRALQAGARSYILKNMPPREIADVIRRVHVGKKRVPPEIAGQMAERLGDERLTDREIDVLRQTAGGIAIETLQASSSSRKRR